MVNLSIDSGAILFQRQQGASSYNLDITHSDYQRYGITYIDIWRQLILDNYQ